MSLTELSSLTGIKLNTLVDNFGLKKAKSNPKKRPTCDKVAKFPKKIFQNAEQTPTQAIVLEASPIPSKEVPVETEKTKLFNPNKLEKMDTGVQSQKDVPVIAIEPKENGWTRTITYFVGDQMHAYTPGFDEKNDKWHYENLKSANGIATSYFNSKGKFLYACQIDRPDSNGPFVEVLYTGYGKGYLADGTVFDGLFKNGKPSSGVNIKNGEKTYIKID